MKIFITPILLFCTCIALAQPTVKTDWLPVFGDVLKTVTLTSESAVDPGPSGANVTYDFSSLMTPDTPDVAILTVVDPTTTPFTDLFTDADIALINTDFGLYTYAKTSGGCLENIGTSVGGLFLQTYSDGQVIACAPLNYQDSFDDSYASTSEFLGVSTFASGSSNILIDGWGTLKMPGSGTEIPNVLRMKMTSVDVDSTDLGSGIREKLILETTTYNFVSADYKNVIFSISESIETQIGMADGIPNDTIVGDPEYDLTYDPEPTEIGTAKVNPIAPEQIEMQIFPNPASNFLQVQFNTEASEPHQIQVFDLTGRLLHAEQVESVFGKNKFVVDVNYLEAGTYLLALQSQSYISSLKFTRL
jgi:hypothetical protein